MRSPMVCGVQWRIAQVALSHLSLATPLLLKTFFSRTLSLKCFLAVISMAHTDPYQLQGKASNQRNSFKSLERQAQPYSPVTQKNDRNLSLFLLRFFRRAVTKHQPWAQMIPWYLLTGHFSSPFPIPHSLCALIFLFLLPLPLPPVAVLYFVTP